MAQRYQYNIYNTASTAPPRTGPAPVDLPLTQAKAITRNRILTATFLILGAFLVALWFAFSLEDLLWERDPAQAEPAETVERVLRLRDPSVGYTGVYLIETNAASPLSLTAIGVDSLLGDAWGSLDRDGRNPSRVNPFSDLQADASIAEIFGTDIVSMLVKTATQFVRMKDYPEAMVQLDKALRIRPGDLNALRLKGTILTMTARYPEAVDLYTALIAEEPYKEECHNNLAVAYMHTERPELAEDHLRQALKINNSYHDARLNLGALLLSQDRYNEVVRLVEPVAAALPDNVQAHRYLGRAFYQLGDSRQARVHFERLVSLQPEQAEHYFNAAKCYALENATDKALAWLQLGVERASEAEVRTVLLDPVFEPLYTMYMFRREFGKFLPGLFGG